MFKPGRNLCHTKDEILTVFSLFYFLVQLLSEKDKINVIAGEI